MVHKKTKYKKAKNTADANCIFKINDNISDTEKSKNEAIVSDNKDNKKIVCDTAENSDCTEGNKEVAEDKSKNKSIEFLKSFAPVIISICSVVWAFLNIMYDLQYKRSAADFYGISGIYFTYDFDIVVLNIAIIIIIVFCTYNIYYYRFKCLGKNICLNKYDKFALLGLIISNTIIMSVILLKYSYHLYDKFLFVNNKSFQFMLNDVSFIILLVILAIIMIFLSVTMYLVVTLDNSSKKSKKEFNNVMTTISLILSFLLIAFYTWALTKLLEFPTEKERNYEFVTTNNSEYVVITHYEDKVLVVPYQCNDDGQYTFYTKNYSFLKPDECTFSYLRLEHLPIINKE